MSIVVREEQPADIPAIREVNIRAFAREHEANIVDALRANGGVVMSLVATLDDHLVGHIMFSPISVGGTIGAALAPMAVLPEHQRKGIGSTLITRSEQRLRDAACPFVIVLGHEEYYPRFGFVTARSRGISCEWDVPDNA